MTLGTTHLQLSSDFSSNKIFKEGSGSFSVASLPGSGETYGSATIAHSFGSDNLIFQVGCSTDAAGTGAKTVLPWASPDGRVIMYARIDSSNLYIYCISSDSSGFGASARTVSYSYRVLVP